MFMGVAKCPGGVDGSLVGVEDYLGFLLLFFACQADVYKRQAFHRGMSVLEASLRNTEDSEAIIAVPNFLSSMIVFTPSFASSKF